ncbi:MAG: hypothetical protein AAGG56_05110 [Pseudomonadota bacterium]
MFGASLRVASILTSVFLIVGCSTLFEDDFEAYETGSSVGVVPNPDPGAPGEIVADRGDPSLYRVQAGSAVSGSQSLNLRFASQGPPDQGPVLAFVPEAPDAVTPQAGSTTSRRPIFFVWSGQITAVSNGSTAIAEIWEGERLLFLVGINDEELRVQVGSTLRARPADFTAGHRVVIRVDAGGYFGVEVSSAGDEVHFCGGSAGCAFGALPGPIDLPSLFMRMRTFEQVPQNDRYLVDAVRTFQRVF